jgi:multidrug resistance efflux pump
VFIFALAILVIVSTRWTRWEGNAEWQSTDDAYLQADLTPIAAKVAGYVRELPVQDFDRVRAGDVLAQIVDDDYRAAVAQLDASVASATAQVQALKAQRELQEANVLAARAAIDATSASAEQNTRDVARQERLLKTGSSSTESAEKLQTVRAQLAPPSRPRPRRPSPHSSPVSESLRSTWVTRASSHHRTASSGSVKSNRVSTWGSEDRSPRSLLCRTSG